MKLISENSNRAHPQDLGSLWREAERLGSVQVEHETWGSDGYKVKIKFARAGSGSQVWATGAGEMIELALSRAIAEAIDLGAPLKERVR